MPPLPVAAAGAIGAAAILEAITSISGSIPDILRGVNTVAEWVKGQEGAKYNVVAFSLAEERPEQDQPPSSLGSTPADGSRSLVSVGELRVIQTRLKAQPILRIAGADRDAL